MIFKLFKIFSSNLFSFENFFVGFKKGAKSIAKTILFGLLFLYLICCFGGMYTLTMYSTYNYLEMAGEPQFMPVVSVIFIFLMLIFFGITSVASNYFSNSGEEQFLSMPISPAEFFGAKFGVSFVTDAVLAIVLFMISNFIYAYKQGILGNPLLYVGILTAGIAISLFCIIMIYFLLIIPLYFFPVLRKKQILSGISVFLLIIFCGFYGFFSSITGYSFSSGDYEKMASPIVGLSQTVLAKIPVLKFIADAINGKIIPILGLVLVSAVILFIFVPLLGRLYVKTLNGFSETKTKKNSSEKLKFAMQKDLQANNVIKSLFLRDIRTVLREPSFFVNGPLMVFLFPFLLLFGTLFGLFSGMENIRQELPQLLLDIKLKLETLDMDLIRYYLSLGGAIFVVLIGNMSSIAITSFSRDGKSLFDLKAMPISNEQIVKVKLYHAILYILITDAITLLILLSAYFFLAMPFSFLMLFSSIINIIVISMAASLVIIVIDMFVDTANPKLLWENPVAAFKQNLNTLAGMLLDFIVIAIMAALGFFLLPKNQFGLVILTALFIIIAAPLGSQYFKYAKKRISQM